MTSKDSNSKSTQDLTAEPAFAGLAWDKDRRLASLNQVKAGVFVSVEASINWYMEKKRPKQRWARGLRLGAILFGSMGTIYPMVAQLKLSWGGFLLNQPVLASICFAVAAGLLLYDRFFGLSSAWIRYLTTGFQLRQLLQEFQVDYEIDRVAWKESEPSEEEVRTALLKCKLLLQTTNQIVRDETSLWAAEFQDTMRQLEEWTKTRARSVEPGALTVKIMNGDAGDGDWKLFVDGRQMMTGRSTTASLPSLPPGLRQIRVEGVVSGKLKSDETVVSVQSGGVATAELKL